MTTHNPPSSAPLNNLTRRALPKLGIITGVALGGWSSQRWALAQDGTPEVDLDQLLPATPVIEDDDEPTLEETEGPYFTPDSSSASMVPRFHRR